jgi:hypothetical protein
VHSIFAIKYWVLSRKISQFINKKENKFIDCKARSIFCAQMLLIISICVSLWFYEEDRFKRVKIFQVFFTLPMYTAFALLAEALWKLSGCGGH